MSQLLFDAFTGVSIDGQTALSVSALLDSQSLSTGSLQDPDIVNDPSNEAPNHLTIGDPSTSLLGDSRNIPQTNHAAKLEGEDESSKIHLFLDVSTDEEDVFQCGKCKKQFTSLPLFMLHKRDHTTNVVGYSDKVMEDLNMGHGEANIDLSSNSNNGTNSFSQLQIHTLESESSELTQSIILSDSDILSFSIDQSALNVGASSQGLPSLSDVIQDGNFMTSDMGLKGLPSPTTGNYNLTALGGQPIILTSSQISPYVASSLSEIQSISPPQMHPRVSNIIRKRPIIRSPGGRGQSQRRLLPKVDSNSEDKDMPGGKILYTEGCLDNSQTVLLNYEDKSIKNVVLPGVEYSEANIEYIDSGVELSSGGEGQDPMVEYTREEGGSLSVGLLDVVQRVSSDQSLSVGDYQPITVSLTGGGPITLSEADMQPITISIEQMSELKNDGKESVDADTHPIALVYTKKGVNHMELQLENSPSDNKDTPILPKPKKQKHLKCEYCSKAFSRTCYLKQHLRIHTGEKPFQCVICGRAFSQKSNVKKHMATHKVWPNGLSKTLPENPLQPIKKDSAKDAEREADNTAEEYKEESCDEDEPQSQEMTVDKSYVCQFCSCVFNSYFELKTHLKEHTHQKVYKCIQKNCHATFTDMDFFIRHTAVHTSEVQYRCHVCSKQFTTLNDLGLHQYTHNTGISKPSTKAGQRYYRCVKCKSQFVSPEGLDHHLATSSHCYECPHCNKVFMCERYLRRHLPTHEARHAFNCELCNKGFRTKQYLNTHMLIHSSEKPYKCQSCSAAFNRKDKLGRHLLIHQSVKKFKCPFRNYLGCMKEFNRQDKLKLHLLTHSTVKVNQCRKCSKTFARIALLRQHNCPFNPHPHTCQQCGTGFKKKLQLSTHFCQGKSDQNLEQLTDKHENPELNPNSSAIKPKQTKRPEKASNLGQRKGRGGGRRPGRSRRKPAKIPEEGEEGEDIPTIEIFVIPKNVGDEDLTNNDMYQVVFPSGEISEEIFKDPLSNPSEGTSNSMFRTIGSSHIEDATSND